jgi:hypothetical protein
METSGSQRLPQLLVRMRLTDKDKFESCDIDVYTIGAVPSDNIKRWVSFVNASSVHQKDHPWYIQGSNHWLDKE